jgi:hypothetical protein
VAHYHDLGWRERVLSLPVMGAWVLSLIWRQVGSVTTVTQLLPQEGRLWTAPGRVSQQALCVRLRAFPADLFGRELDDLLPQMQARWQERRRPRPRSWPGRGSASRLSWPPTARPWTRGCAKWACCATARTPRWPGA